MKPTLTVIIPSNSKRKETFKKLFKSLQGFEHQIQIIICLNGISHEEYNQIEINIHNVEKIWIERPHVNVARNQGVQWAQADALLFLDDDTYFSSSKIIEDILYFVTTQNNDWAAGGFYKGYGDSLWSKYYIQKQECFHQALIEQGVPFLMGGFLLISKDFFNKIGGFDERVNWGGAELEINRKIIKSGVLPTLKREWLLQHEVKMSYFKLIHKGYFQGRGARMHRHTRTKLSQFQSSWMMRYAEQLYQKAFNMGYYYAQSNQTNIPAIIQVHIMFLSFKVYRFLRIFVNHRACLFYWKIQWHILNRLGYKSNEIDDRLRKFEFNIDRLKRFFDLHQETHIGNA